MKKALALVVYVFIAMGAVHAQEQQVDSIIKMSKVYIGGGAAFTTLGAMNVGAGAALLAVSNTKLNKALGATAIALGAALLVAGPVMISEGVKLKKGAKELQATIELRPGSLLVRF